MTDIIDQQLSALQQAGDAVMHVGIGTGVITLVGVEIDLICQELGMILLDIFRQPVGLFGMHRRITIGIATVVGHEGQVVFPTSLAGVLHIIQDLVYHLARLRRGTYWETAHSDTHLVSLQPRAGAIFQQGEIIIGHVGGSVERGLRLIGQQHIREVQATHVARDTPVIVNSVAEEQQETRRRACRGTPVVEHLQETAISGRIGRTARELIINRLRRDNQDLQPVVLTMSGSQSFRLGRQSVGRNNNHILLLQAMQILVGHLAD